MTKEISKPEELEQSEVVYYAVLKALENIGEAVKHMPEETKIAYPLDWRKIAGLRDIISHQYFGIDAPIIWDIVINKLPELKSISEKIQRDMEDKN